jgi:hypothetical protein
VRARVYQGAYGPLPDPARLGVEAAGVAVLLCQDFIATLVDVQQHLEDWERDDAIIRLRDAECDTARYLRAADLSTAGTNRVPSNPDNAEQNLENP